MAIGMATAKITVTLEVEQIAAIRELVEQGKADSASGFVQHAVSVSLADVAGWGAMLGLALDRTGGPLSSKERTWADSILRSRSRSKRKRKAA
jgi:Arc/MetJ-type ribon-helix-helix transcriptional regulator